MHPFVRELYRQLLHAGSLHPEGKAFIRDRAKVAIFAEKHLLVPPRTRVTTRLPNSEHDDSIDYDAFMKAIYKGRWWVKELAGIIQLHKYRYLRRRF
jgi:hypothetical protein